MLAIVGEFDSAAFDGSGSYAFANPKSSTFTLPSAVILMLASFRSRWMIQRGQHPRFAFEPRQTIGIASEGFGEKLDGDAAA